MVTTEKENKIQFSEPDFSSPEKALEQMKAHLGEVAPERVSRWVVRFLNIPGVFGFLLESVKKLEPLKCVDSTFPLWGVGEGYGAEDYEPCDELDARNLLLAYVQRLKGKKQLHLLGIPGAEAYFVEIAKSGIDLCDEVQIQLLRRGYGKRVFRMYVYQCGRRCDCVRERWSVGDLLYDDLMCGS